MNGKEKLFAALSGVDEALLERYLETGEVPEEALTDLIRRRKLFPCLFGSALKLEGVDEFLAALERYVLPRKGYFDWKGPYGGGFVLDAGRWQAGRVLTLVERGEHTR